VLVTETSAQEAAMAWDSVDLRIKGAKDGAALAQREALEQVSRVEVENFAVLSFAEEHRAREASEKEHQEHFMELGALSSAMPSSALLGQDTCPRGCGLQPSAIQKWPGNLPHIRWRCPPPWTQCSSAHLATLLAWWW
jgi:hypothetical protein